MKLSPLSASFQQPAWTSPPFFRSSAWLCAVCPVELKHPLCSKIHAAICFRLAAHLSTRTAEMNAYRAQSRRSPGDTEPLRPGIWCMIQGILNSWLREAALCTFFKTLNEILLQNWWRHKDSSGTARTKVFRIFNERTRDAAVFVVNTTPPMYQGNTTPSVSQRIKSWKSPYV